MVPFSQKSLHAVGDYCHHIWDNTCQAVHELSRKQNQDIGKDGFHVSLDLSDFQRDEIWVRTVDQSIVVEAKHTERDDSHSPVERHMVRKYYLPKEYDMNAIHTELTSDGILIVKVPLPQIATPEERLVPITYINGSASKSLDEDDDDQDYQIEIQ